MQNGRREEYVQRRIRGRRVKSVSHDVGVVGEESEVVIAKMVEGRRMVFVSLEVKA